MNLIEVDSTAERITLHAPGGSIVVVNGTDRHLFAADGVVVFDRQPRVVVS